MQNIIHSHAGYVQWQSVICRWSTLQITKTYFLTGLFWVFAYDAVLYGAGFESFTQFWQALCGGVLFFLITAAGLFLFIRQNRLSFTQASALLMAVTEGTNDAVFVKDRAGDYLLLNSAASRLLGKSETETPGKDSTSHFDSETSRRLHEIDQRVMESGKTETTQQRFTSSGVERDYLTTLAPMRDDRGSILGVVGIARDVTERVRAEAELRAERNRFEKILETAPVVICSFQLRPDGSMRFLYSSRRIEDIYEIPRERLIEDASPLFTRIHADDTGKVRSTIEASARDLSTWRCEFRVMHPTRGEIWIEGRSSPVRRSDGSTVWHGFIADITDRKRAENAAIEAHMMLRQVIDTVPYGVFWKDRQSRHLGCNLTVARALGFRSPEDVVGKADTDLPGVTAAQAAKFMQIDREVVESCVPRLRVTEQLTRPDGSTLWLETNKLPLRDITGNVVGVIGTWEDVSERRRTDVALRESERRLRLALGATRMLAWEFDPSTGGLAISDNASDLFGLPSGSTLRLVDEAFGLVHPEDLERHRTTVMNAVAERGTFLSRFRVVRPSDGGIVWMEDRGQAILGEDGSVRLGGVMMDITARKQADVALQESEWRFRQIFENAATGIAITRSDGRFLQCNPAYCAVLGRTEEELRTAELSDLIHPDDRVENMDLLQRLAIGEIPRYEVENRFLHKSGEPRWVHKWVTSLNSPSGRATYLMALVTDVTERRRAERILREGKERLRSVLNSVDDAILTIDVTGTVESANPATERLFGYAEDEVVGNNIGILMTDADRGKHDEYIASYLRTGVARVIGIGKEVQGRRRDGTTFPLELAVTELRLEGERHFTGVLRDISARRRLEEQFRQAQKMDAIGRLAGGVAHDFNNLLTVINGYSDLLLLDLSLNVQQRAHLSAIRDAGERAAGLTSQLLAFSRKAIVAPKLFDLKMVASQSEKLLRRLIGEDVVLSLILHPAPCPVRADPNQVDQVIMNLAVNARDAMPTGGRLILEVRPVTFTGSEPIVVEQGIKPGDYVELAVTDSGTGIPPEIQARIFEPFFTTKGEGKGTGLGLATVFGIVHQAGGHVIVLSEVNRGTTFRILLPAAMISPSTAIQIDPAPRRGTETVLLVEDDDAVRTLTTIALESHGYKVVTASNGTAALDILRSDRMPRIRLLVTDVVMPEMSGRELADAARTAVPSLRVLFVSGYTNDELFRHGVREAADAFLQKPFSPMGLARKVREVLDAG